MQGMKQQDYYRACSFPAFSGMVFPGKAQFGKLHSVPKGKTFKGLPSFVELTGMIISENIFSLDQTRLSTVISKCNFGYFVTMQYFKDMKGNIFTIFFSLMICRSCLWKKCMVSPVQPGQSRYVSYLITSIYIRTYKKCYRNFCKTRKKCSK